MIHPEIVQLAQTNPLVYAAMSMYRNGQCTYERALVLAVVGLAQQNSALIDSAIKAAQECTKPALILQRPGQA
jgi:hypothetical protein